MRWTRLFHIRSSSRRSFSTGKQTAGAYSRAFESSLVDPPKFWGEAAKAVRWLSLPDGNETLFDGTESPHPNWFPEREANACYNCIDFHAATGRGNQPAIIYDSPITGTQRTLTYNELLDLTSRFAGAMRAYGVMKGDPVIIYMPMVPEAIIAMMACARLGAVHVVVFGGFASAELAKRLNDCKPKLVITASCGIEPGRVVSYKPMVDEALKMCKMESVSCVVLQRPQLQAQLRSNDIDWNKFLAVYGIRTECVVMKSTDPLYVLHTSGTTGTPKGVLRDIGSYLVAMEWSMTHVYDVKPGEVWWAASDIGWVVGHSYIVYAPLVHGCTTVLFEGKPIGTPDEKVFWRVIAQHRVAAMFTAPTAIRAIKKLDPTAQSASELDFSHFRTLFLAGERADSDTVAWSEKVTGKPVVDHWWQTETGWAIAANCIGLEAFPVKRGSATMPCPGYNITIVDENGKVVPPNTTGQIIVKLPMPPGFARTLWNNDKRYIEAYMSQFPGYYHTGDAGYFDDDGYLFVMSRTDDVMNVAGHRLSAGGLEEVLSSHPDVAECAVVAHVDSLKGHVPVGFVVLNSRATRDTKIIKNELVVMVREQIGPVASFKDVVFLKRLPKTRSGKILRATMRSITDENAYTAPATIEDPQVLDEIKQALSLQRLSEK